MGEMKSNFFLSFFARPLDARVLCILSSPGAPFWVLAFVRVLFEFIPFARSPFGGTKLFRLSAWGRIRNGGLGVLRNAAV